MPMAINASPLSIPYTHNVGDSVKCDFSDAMKQADIGAIYGDPQGFSGAYLHFLNDTDFALYGTYSNSGMMCVLLPGQEHYCPINTKDVNVVFVIMGKNTTNVHTQSLLHVFYLDRGDISSGHQVIASAGLNPSTPAGSIGPGALPEGVTIGADDVGVSAPSETFGAFAFLPAPQVSAGTFPTGVIEPAAQVGAGTLASNVFLSIINSDGGKITSDGTGNLTIALGGALFTPRVNLQGTLSASNKTMDLQQNYQFFSDNTGAVGTTRLWYDGPDRGEFQIGPRTGANYFDWIRLRATRVTIDLGKNSSPNTIFFEVTGGKTQLDNNAIHSDGSGNLTAVSFIGNLTGNASGSAGSVAAANVTAGNLGSGVKQQNGSTIAGIDSAGGGAAGTRIWVGTTDPGGSAAEGDVWLPV